MVLVVFVVGSVGFDDAVDLVDGAIELFVGDELAQVLVQEVRGDVEVLCHRLQRQRLVALEQLAVGLAAHLAQEEVGVLVQVLVREEELIVGLQQVLEEVVVLADVQGVGQVDQGLQVAGRGVDGEYFRRVDDLGLQVRPVQGYDTGHDGVLRQLLVAADLGRGERRQRVEQQLGCLGKVSGGHQVDPAVCLIAVTALPVPALLDVALDLVQVLRHQRVVSIEKLDSCQRQQNVDLGSGALRQLQCLLIRVGGVLPVAYLGVVFGKLDVARQRIELRLVFSLCFFDFQLQLADLLFVFLRQCLVQRFVKLNITNLGTQIFVVRCQVVCFDRFNQFFYKLFPVAIIDIC